MLRLATKFRPERTALDTAYRAGFRHAELWLDAAVLAEWENVARLCMSYPNGYAMHFPNRLDLEPATLEHAVALYRALNARAVVIHQPMMVRHGAALRRLAPELPLAVENHVLTPDGLLAWAEHNPGLTLDVEHVWHLTLPGASLDDLLNWLRTFLARFADKLLHVHLPGCWPGCREHRPMYCGRDLVFPVFSLLAEVNFDGLVVSEADSEYQNETELRMDVLLFDAWRARHEPRA